MNEPGASKRVNVLYFAYLPKKRHRESETLDLPEKVGDVQSLLTFLQRQRRDRGDLVAADNVQVTVNEQFSEPFTRIDDGDEIGIVPVSPTPRRGG
jgi:molybdopterin converting factor small subunit